MKKIAGLTTSFLILIAVLSVVHTHSATFFPQIALPRVFAGTGEPESAARFEPSSKAIVGAMLNLAGVTERDVVYDLGSGDGRVVIAAAAERGARGIGVDIDPELIRESRRNAVRENVSDLAQFRLEDLFKTDLGKATVVMLYLSPDANLKLRPRLLTELKPGTRIVSHSHDMGDWKADKQLEVENHSVYLWTVPADVSGKWKLVVPDKDPGDQALQFRQSFQDIEATLQAGKREIAVTGCAIQGKTVHFTVERELGSLGAPIAFTGEVEGNRITGSLQSQSGSRKWRAERVQ